MNTSTSHPTEEALRAYGLGRLDDAPAASVHSHLEGCPECRRRVAEITSDSFLGRLRDAKAGNPSSGPAVSSTDGLSMLGTGPAPAAPPPASTLPPGLAALPNYEILRELGQGGMGAVFLARNTLMGRMEVLKVVSGHLVNRRGILDRFLGEIRNAARLLHPNIVAAYTALQLGDSLVLAMEYVEGLDLSRLVKAKGPLPVAHACSYVHQAALGLQHAHEHGMVHRDIKPSNLMLAKQGNRGVVKVLDFGLAKVTSEGAVDGGLTYEGQMLGTPDYIAPEQISNARRADIRADIYSLGCTLYYLLAGKPPFQGESLYDLLQAHHSMDATPLNLARPEVPVEVAAIVAKMMAKEPGRRFQEPKEVARALKPFFKSGRPTVQGQEPEVSRAGQTGSGRPVPGLVSTPTQPATIDEGPVVRPKTPAEPSSPAAPWQSLIDLGETERTRDRTPVLVPMRRRPWFWPSVAVGALILGLLIAWGVVIRVKTTDGMIELVNLPKDAEVLVDGKEVAVTWPGGGNPAVITVPAGKRKVEVKKDGFEVYGDEVTVLAGVKEPFTVRLIPLADSRPKPDTAADRTARSDDAKTPSAPGDRGAATPPPTSPPVSEVRPEKVPGTVDSLISLYRSASNSLGMELKLIPAGKFVMGAPNDPNLTAMHPFETERARPAHEVRITRPFYIGIHEVTQEQYQRLMKINPSHFSGPPNLPVDSVSWYDAIEFCNRLSAYEKRPPYYRLEGDQVSILRGEGYRLPTEAEWEYACRGGTQTIYPHGDDWERVDLFAWTGTNSGKRTHPVGELKPNGFGLYDMTGNVFEWCWDWYRTYPDEGNPVEDPMGPATGTSRVSRGCAYQWNTRMLYSSLFRGSWPNYIRSPGVRIPHQGFRIARDATEVAGKVPGTVDSPRPKPGPTRLDNPMKPITNSIGMKLVLIPAGVFWMGSPDEDTRAPANEKPQHPVRITRPFYLGVTEVTRGQFRQFVEATGYKTEAERDGKGGGGVNNETNRWEHIPKLNWLNPGSFEQTDEHPVVQVSWNDAVAFAEWLSSKEGKTYRLPTEAEWEYACRAGSPPLRPLSDDASARGEYVDHIDGPIGTHPAGQNRPNAWGLHGMLGNVTEWCADRWDEKYYASSPATDPLAAAQGSSGLSRVQRGSNWWANGPLRCRPAFRIGIWAWDRFPTLGFRLALNVKGEDKADQKRGRS